MRYVSYLRLMVLSLLLAACLDAGNNLVAEPATDNDLLPETAAPAADAPGGATAQSTGRYAAIACPFPVPAGADVTCGALTVPENRSQPNGRTVRLAVAVVAAPDPAGRPPLVYLAGGPGGSAIDDFLNDPTGWDYPFTRQRDLILIDQRGTGYSTPSLDCPELSEEATFGVADPAADCRRRLEADGVDLTAYNSVENAADVAALRAALGIPSWDLVGISYGTRLALIIMRDHPQGVRSAVLDSVFPPNADTPGEEALATLWSWQNLLADCAADDYCARTYPDLEGVFLDTVAALNEAPVDDLYGDDLVYYVTAALNDMDLIPLVPAVIYAVAEGDVGALADIAPDDFGRGRFQDDTDRSDSEGMYNAVICHEEYVFGDYETAEARLLAEAPVELEAALLQPVADQFRICADWGAGRAGALENEAVRSDIPTLILAGQYDSATPPAWARLAAATLPNATVVTFPDAGHSLLSGHTCAIAITAAFLDAPARSPDTGCVDDIVWPYFE